MSWIDGWRVRLRTWLRRSAVEREIEEEFGFHVEREAEALRADGLDDGSARRQAQVRFGGSAGYREEVRDVWTGRAGRLAADLRLGLRLARRQPLFSAVAVLTLGLGIGANTAIFSLVRSVLLQPLPYAEPDELVVLWNRSADLADDTWTSEREIVEYRRALTTLDGIAAYTDLFVNVSEGEPERLPAAVVTANLFDTLGVTAAVGRTFLDGDGRPGADLTAVLGHELWQRQFNGDTSVVGRDVRISGRPAQVIGVAPAGFRLPLDYREPRPTEVFLPAQIDTAHELPWGDRSYFIIGRLAPGTHATAAAADLHRLHLEWERAGYLEADGEHRDRALLPIGTLAFGHLSRALTLLFAAVGLLLLIACANVSHLLLARGDARRRELATQAVLGASRGRLTAQLLTESFVLALFGALVGVAFAYGVLAAVMAWTPVNAIRNTGVRLDGGVLAFTAGIAAFATLVAGVLPALSLSRAQAGQALSGARVVGAGARSRARHVLVVGEMALSLVLVLSAALVAQSYAGLRRVDLGFDPGSVATLRVDLPPVEYQGERAAQFFRDVVARFSEVSGVQTAGGVRVLPLSGTIGDWSITIEHRPVQPRENPNADWQVVTPGYFETMAIPMRRGRTIRPGDDAGAPLAAVVSETMAARYWPDEDAVGRRFHLGTANQPWIEIVGVAADVRHNTVIETPRAEMYIPHAQWTRATGGSSPRYGMTLVARVSGDPAAVLPTLREAIRAVDAGLPVSDARPMRQVADSALAAPRFTTLLLGGFATLALLLAAVGLFGVVSFMTAGRTREIGVRMALGARPMAVCLLVIRDSLTLTAAGVAIGLVASFWITRFLAGQLHEVSTTDAVTFLTAPLLLFAVAAVAAYLPAWRAVRIAPTEALRLE